MKVVSSKLANGRPGTPPVVESQREVGNPRFPFFLAEGSREMAESTEVQIARLDERLKMLLDKLEEDAEGHEKIQDFIVATNMALASISTRIQNVEASLSMNKPVIDEFITIKHKVVGAGTLGKWLWVAGAAILGYIASSRELIGNIIRGFQQ